MFHLAGKLSNVIPPLFCCLATHVHDIFQINEICAKAALLLRENRSFNRQSKSTSVVISVTVLCATFSSTTTTFNEMIRENSSLQVSGFDTLTGLQFKYNKEPRPVEHGSDSLQRTMKSIQIKGDEVLVKVRRLDLQPGAEVRNSEDVYGSGIVIGVVLRRFRYYRDVGRVCQMHLSY